MHGDNIETTPGDLDGERRQDHREWRASVEQWQRKTDARLDEGAKNFRLLRAEVADNTTMTKQVEANTSEVVSLLQSFQGAFKVFNLIGKFAKPLTYIVMAVTAVITLWTTWKSGGKP